MPHPSSICLLLGTLALAGSVMAQPVGDAGKLEYDASCANCHGLEGKGNGPVTGYAHMPEWYVRGRILALLDYIARLQAN